MTHLAFTICSVNYLAYAKTLADSLVLHNPQHKFVIFLLDETTHIHTEAFLPHELKPIAELQLSGFENMNNRYNIFELSCALKPYIVDWIFKNMTDVNTIYYFDSDILVFNSLHESDAVLQHKPILITPHIFTPIPVDGLFSNEDILLRAGIYNAGFFGVSRCETTFTFLKWWKERMFNKCYNDMANGLFVDQLWLNFVPVYFPATEVFMHPGYNVAYWNFHERKLTGGDDNYRINDQPLVFFHFSGYDLLTPDVISKHQDRYSFANKGAFQPLFLQYKNAVDSNNDAGYDGIQPAFGYVPAPPESPKKKKTFLQKIFS